MRTLAHAYIQAFKGVCINTFKLSKVGIDSIVLEV